jgi:putative ABC transport system permease protein
MRIVVALMPPFTLPSETVIELNVPVLAAAVLASLAAGVVAGLAPAWPALRVNAADAMKQGGRAVTTDRRRLARALVVVEMALALVLLATGAAAVDALASTARADRNIRPDGVVTMGLPVAAGRLETAEARELFYRKLLDEVGRQPGVVAVTASSGMPIWGSGFGDAFEIVGRPHVPGTEPPGAGINSVTPG